MTDASGQDLIYLNGISGVTGTYDAEPLSVADLAQMAKGATWGADHWDDLQKREFQKQDSFQILPEFGDGSDISQANWGIIFPAGADPSQVDAILQALSPLVSLRETQMGHPAKIYRGPDGFRWLQPPLVTTPRPESKNEWLTRNGAGPGQVDPTIVPYYVLIIGDPQSIPYVFQYEMDVQYAIGRLYFRTLAEYANYASSVVKAESGQVKLARRAVFFGVSNTGDKATGLSAEYLVKPLKAYVDDRSPKLKLGWQADLVDPANADRSTLKALLGGSQTPALVFTASHGINFPYQHPDQTRLQGGLVCQDWPGPSSPATREHYLAGEDIPEGNNLLGSIVFHFACYGAGTPYWDDYAIARYQNRKALASYPFVAALPSRLLSLPEGGALAVIGHVDRAWNYSFQWGSIAQHTTAYQGILYQLMVGKQAGLAMDSMNDRYSEISTMLANTIQNLKFTQNPTQAQLAEAAFQFASNNDSRGYAILGDPAVRIPMVPADGGDEVRQTIHIDSPVLGTLPAVFDPGGLAALGPDEQAAAQKDSGPSATPTTTGQPTQTPAAPVQTIVPNAPPPGAVPPPTSVMPLTQPPAQGRPFSTPIDGLAFALQAYTTAGPVAFDLGMEGTSFNILDDAKDKVKDVVVSLNNALSNLAKKMEQATSDLASLEVTTGVSDDLETFDPDKADLRIRTQITAGGDIKVFVPREGGKLDDDLLALHQSMVKQALQNRMDVARAVAEMIAGLFGGQKQP